jgi:hypothetical protein
LARSPHSLLLALVAWIVLEGCSGSSKPRYAFGSWTPDVRAAADIAPLEKEMLQRVNADRKKQGLAPLRWDARLADIARAHSDDMRKTGFFAHESPNTGVLEDRMDRAGYLAVEMRENLAQAGDVAAAEENLLKSPGHRANLFAENVTHLGVGIVRGSHDGDPSMLTITQVFARPAELETPAQVKAKVTAALAKARLAAGHGPLAPHAMLEELVGRYLPEVPEGVPEGAVDEVGERISRELNDRQGHGLGAIQVVAQAVFDAGEFAVPESIGDSRTAAIAIATAETKDARGRPRVKVLVLLGAR